MRAVQYEFNQLAGAAAWLSGHLAITIEPASHAAAPMTPEVIRDFFVVLRNGTLEAFLVHARNLIDFFIGPQRPKQTDILAADFFDRGIWVRGLQRGRLQQVRFRIGKKLSHLSYERLNDHDGWDVGLIVAQLADLTDRFNALNPAYAIDIDLKRVDELK